MLNGSKKYQFGNPLKIKFRKHVCPFCGGNMVLIENQKIVNSKSNEAKYYDFTIGEGNIVGDCIFFHKVFYCNECDCEIEPVTQLNYEDILIHLEKLQKKYAHFNYSLDFNSKDFFANVEGSYFAEISIFCDNQKYEKVDFNILRKKYWERPYYIEYKRLLLKKIIKKLLND